ncbi:hypothetical protein ILYODFUR_002530 [Ilyodon furcidens]|uniref:Uncharacterized protein n=1 Tax=Ilyodon furcidens TaxID=33524 RepID=A0ABV0UDJ3_9TELE
MERLQSLRLEQNEEKWAKRTSVQDITTGAAISFNVTHRCESRYRKQKAPIIHCDARTITSFTLKLSLMQEKTGCPQVDLFSSLCHVNEINPATIQNWYGNVHTVL